MSQTSLPTILFICSDATLYEQVATTFKPANVKILWAKNGSEAIIYSTTERFHIIITELELSDMTVKETLDEIYTLQQIQIPLILFEEHPSLDTILSLIRFGTLKDFVKKSHLPRLYASVKKILVQLSNESLAQSVIKWQRQSGLSETQLWSILEHSQRIHPEPTQPRSVSGLSINQMQPQVTLSRNNPVSHQNIESSTQSNIFFQKKSSSEHLTVSDNPNISPSQSNDASREKSDVKPAPTKDDALIQDSVRLLRDRLRKGDLELPTMPVIAQEFNKLVSSDPHVSNTRIVELLEKDQSITSQVIKSSNSAYYSRMKRVKTISEALIRLGVKDIYNLVQTFCLRKFFRMKSAEYETLIEKIWGNTIATAYIARRISEIIEDPEPESMYLGSLFINIGESFLVKLISEIHTLSNNRGLLENLSDKYHVEFGSALLSSWKFNQQQVALCSYHHHSNEQLSELAIPDATTVTKQIYIANVSSMLSEQEGYVYFNRKNTPKHFSPSFDNSIQYLQLDTEKMKQAVVGLSDFVSETLKISH